MTPAQREALNARLHLALAVLAVWLVATSPWVSMLRRVPASAGFFDHAHVALGLLALVLAVVYCVTLSPGGRWQWFFPWAAGQAASIGRDLAGIARGQVPAADGPGLYGAIKGMLLLTLILTGASGIAWLLQHGSDAALGWRELHIVFARTMIAAGVLHVLAVASHLLEQLRD